MLACAPLQNWSSAREKERLTVKNRMGVSGGGLLSRPLPSSFRVTPSLLLQSPP